MDKGPLPRVAAFDHVRGLAVIFMIISHIPLILGTSGAEKSVIGLIMSQVCGTAPAAPVFMVLMGIFFSYPYDKPTGTKVRRGVKIFLLGMLLNLGRFMVPALIGASFIPGFAESMTATFHMSGREMVWYAIYSPDILHFAGIAFIILALMGPLVERPYVWGAIAVAVACIAPGLWGTGEGKAFYPLVQPLWGSALSPGVPADTTFPVFPWLVYPMVGALIGRSLMAGMDEGTLFRRMLAGGSALIVIGGIVVLFRTTAQFGDYCRMFPGGTLVVSGFALVWISLFLWLGRSGLFQKGLSHLTFWSEHITLIYCVQWVLLGNSTMLFGFKGIRNPWILLALVPVYLFLSYAVARLLLRSDRFMGCFRWFTR